MRLEKQLIAFGVFLLVGSTLLTAGPALAFGQQWRPVPGYGPSTTMSYPPAAIAIGPSFRPYRAARPSIERPMNRYLPRTNRRPGSLYGQPYPQYFAAWQAVPWGPHPRYPGHGYYRMPQSISTGFSGSRWAGPYAAMRPHWGRQMPLFARQFAWRPAAQPWVAQVPAPLRPPISEPRYDRRMAPPTMGFRPTGRSNPPALGSWRPALHPAAVARLQYAYQGRGAPSPFPAGRHQPLFRTVPGSGYGVAHNSAAAPVASGRPYWRPAPTFATPQRHLVNPFRPPAYGHSRVDRANLASRSREGLRSAPGRPPGWVTTEEDSGFDASCGWCSGS